MRFLIVFMTLSCAVVLRAQDTSSMTGTITDTTGAAVPGATVELTNPATGQAYKTVSGANGGYTFPNVTPGPGYKETVSRDGFETSVVTDLYLNVATTRTQNVKLAVGAVSQTVAVSASNEDVTLDTTDSTVGNNFEVQYLNDLPVALRDSPTALLAQQPGMTSDGSATGARTDQNRLTLDGLDVNDMATGATLNAENNGAGRLNTIIGNAPVDSLQEFRGTTAGDLASEDGGGGGQFQMVTKSGTNHFHGNINEYHRDTDLEANEWFNNFSGIPRSPLIRNQFGGNVGGPIWKNKAFFFFDYNGRRDTLAGQAERVVPTDSFLKDQTITYYTNIAAQTKGVVPTSAVASYDPQGVGFDSAMMSAIGARYPSPNDFTGDKGDLLNTAGYRFNAPTPYKENNYVGRLDINPFEKHHFFGRVTYNRTNGVNKPAQFPTDPETFPYIDNSHAWVAGWDWTISSNKTNSVIWGETVANLGFPVTYNPQGPNQYGWDGDPTGGFFLDGIYASAAGAQSRIFPIPVVRDDFHWDKGRHSLSFGGTFKYPSPHFSNYNDYNGPNLGLGGGVTGLPNTPKEDSWQFGPNDLDPNQTSLTIYDSAFVFGLGRYASTQATYNYTAAGSVVPQGTGLQTKFKYYETEVYFGDTWKMTPSLTFSYGVRYQSYTVPYEVHGLEAIQSESFNNFMAARLAQSAAGIGGDASLPGGTAPVPYITYNLGGKANNARAYYSPSKYDFAPRVAFAWTPYADHKLVVNGGGGVVFDQTVVNAFLQEEAQYSYLFQSSGTKNFGLPGTAQHSPAYYTLLNDPRFTALSTPPQGPTAPTITKPYSPFIGPSDPNCGGTPGPCGLANGNAFNVSVDSSLPTPYNIVYNFGIQQEIKGGYILKLGYAGRLGRRLLAQADAEQLLDFPDKASGQELSQAIANLTTWLRQNPNSKTPPPSQPWFENVLNKNTTGTSNTAFIASNLAPYPARGDVADTVELMSNAGLLPANVGMAAQFSENTFFTDKGFSSYNGLLATLHKNSSHGLQFDLNYTWSHSIDNVSLIANSYAFNGYGFLCDITRPRICRADSDFDVTNYLNGNFLYQLPFGHGRDFLPTLPRWADEAIGGWSLSGLPSWHTGTPYMANSVAFLMSYSNEDPAILTGGLGPMKSHVTVSNGQVYAFKDYQTAFNQYQGPTGFEMGARNNLRGPHYFDLDLGLGKTFPIYKEGVNLKFRVDAFNALNHPNFQSPSFENNMSLVAAPNEFGVIPGTVVPNGSDQAARVLQGALRLEF